MDVMEKPIVLVSKCLEFEPCRWNGVSISSPEVDRLKTVVHFKPVCPEVEIGLGVPRDPIRVILKDGKKHLHQPETGRDMTETMNRFTRTHLENLGPVDGFILKEKSPSCGTQRVKIYPGPGKVPVAYQGSGFFGGAVLERYPHLPVMDEGRLTNFNIREYFLTRLFAVFRFRQLKRDLSVHNLMKFQANNKFLFMAYNQKEMRILGSITANREKRALPLVIEEYSRHFYNVFARMPRHTSHINVLMHGLGYVSHKITKEERDYFLHLLELFRQGKHPLGVALGVIKSWILRFEIEYLQHQTYFDPYPEELMHLSDSGKGKI